MIDEHIYAVRGLIKEHSDDSNFTDSFIYQFLISARAEIIRQKANKNHYQSRFNFQTACVPLDCSSYEDCDDCLPDMGCKLRKSRIKIPVPVSSRSKDLFNVRTFSGQKLTMLSPEDFDSSKESIFLKDRPSYWISNQYLIVWQPITLKAVIIDAIFSDPTDLANVYICDEDGSTSDEACYNPLKDEFPMDADIWEEVYTRAFNKLTNSQRVPDDKLNNAETELDRKL